MATDPVRTYPSELPVLALRQTVVFPLTLQPLAIHRPTSIDSVNRALNGDRLLFLALQNTDADTPQSADLRTIGTIGAIRQMAKNPTGGIHVIAPDGKLLGRIRIPDHCTNMAWGDADWRSLYITTYTSVFRTRVNVPGVPVW